MRIESNGTIGLEARENKKHKVLENCQVLKEYTKFMECVEKHQATGTPYAMELAIIECIDKGILKEYLKRKGSKVMNKVYRTLYLNYLRTTEKYLTNSNRQFYLRRILTF